MIDGSSSKSPSSRVPGLMTCAVTASSKIATTSAVSDSSITVPCGSSPAYSSSAVSLNGLIRNADRALHEAKKAGRNQTAVFHAPLFAAS